MTDEFDTKEPQINTEAEPKHDKHDEYSNYFVWGAAAITAGAVFACYPGLAMGAAAYAAFHPQEACKITCSVVGEAACFCSYPHN